MSKDLVGNFLNDPKIGSASLSAIQMRLHRPGAEQLKADFDRRVKEMRLALLKQIEDLDQCTEQVAIVWMSRH